MQRFAPLNSWPDNVKPGQGAPTALAGQEEVRPARCPGPTLMIFTGNRALETMGFKTFGFAGGRGGPSGSLTRTCTGAPSTPGSATSATSGDRDLEQPFGAVQMGPDLRQPGGPPTATRTRWPRPRDIRETFGRMAMNDEETVALIAGGHTFGKTHGANLESYKGPDPEGRAAGAAGSRLEQQFRQAARAGTPSAAAWRVTWTPTPVQWSNWFLPQPVRVRLGAHQEARPARTQWTPKDGKAKKTPSQTRRTGTLNRTPGMLTSDLALQVSTRSTSRSRGGSTRTRTRLAERVSARAWYKLTHRDMGPDPALPRAVGTERGADLAGPGAGPDR